MGSSLPSGEGADVGESCASLIEVLKYFLAGVARRLLDSVSRLGEINSFIVKTLDLGVSFTVSQLGVLRNIIFVYYLSVCAQVLLPSS